MSWKTANKNTDIMNQLIFLIFNFQALKIQWRLALSTHLPHPHFFLFFAPPPFMYTLKRTKCSQVVVRVAYHLTLFLLLKPTDKKWCKFHTTWEIDSHVSPPKLWGGMNSLDTSNRRCSDFTKNKNIRLN